MAMIPMIELTEADSAAFDADVMGTLNHAAARQLGPDEYWALIVDGQAVPGTESKNFLEVPMVACTLLNIDDWDDITEAGGYIGKAGLV